MMATKMPSQSIESHLTNTHVRDALNLFFVYPMGPFRVALIFFLGIIILPVEIYILYFNPNIISVLFVFPFLIYLTSLLYNYNRRLK